MTLSSIPKIVKEWSCKNTISPRMVWLTSSKKYIRKCGSCNREYSQIARNMKNHGCSVCNNIGESILYKYLQERYENIESQVKFSWSHNYSFDFRINNVLIEVDGKQHFSPISHWNDGWKLMHTDLKKEELALQNNFFVIRLLQKDIYCQKKEWQIFLNEVMEKIKEKKIAEVFTQNCNEYNKGIYKRLRCETFF
tara:strand:+ start:698 stop:1282 length:585 start_codon:yes stop_codon:yes gene_type:complete